MTISAKIIEDAAPDQASLKAATKLLKPAQWPVRMQASGGGLIWGACQGSGANPYRVAVDLSDLGSKCSCPSRKFPCKHALALMLFWSAQQADFSAGETPEWITDWLGRRRKSASGAAKPTAEKALGKSLQAAREEDIPTAEDPKTQARRQAAKIKRAQATRQSINDGLVELEGWIADQLRTGLTDLLGDLTARCRRIASRLVDAKAGTLAARIDGFPSHILELPARDRPDALISALGKLVLISRGWRNEEITSAALKREIVGAEPRDTLLQAQDAVHQNGYWEVLASREENRRDGLIARSTWLLCLSNQDRQFALLQDFYPASLGAQGNGFSPGEQFHAEVVFYPADLPLRAQIVERTSCSEYVGWPGSTTSDTDILEPYADALIAEPWHTTLPLHLPRGRIALSGSDPWWQGNHGALPLVDAAFDRSLLGAELSGAVVLWNGFQADLLAAESNLGRYHAER
ncbi:MAG: SWIM zinc finger family protein [Stappiaceae bacterium]